MSIIVHRRCKIRKPLSEIRIFRSFYAAACHGYRTRAGWERSLRRVAATTAGAIIVRKVGIITGLAGYEVVLQDLGQNRFEVATDYVNAYSMDQTRPFTRSSGSPAAIPGHLLRPRQEGRVRSLEGGSLDHRDRREDRPPLESKR